MTVLFSLYVNVPFSYACCIYMYIYIFIFLIVLFNYLFVLARSIDTMVLVSEWYVFCFFSPFFMSIYLQMTLNSHHSVFISRPSLFIH